MSSFRIERHETFEQLSASEWEDLRSRHAAGTIFQSHAWNAAWWTCKGSLQGELVLLSARKGRQLVGIAPLFLASGKGMGRSRELAFLGRPNADYCDFLVDESTPEVAHLLLEAATAIPESWTVLALGNLLERAALAGVLSSGTYPNLECLETTPCPAVTDIPGQQTFSQLTQKKMLRQNTKLLTKAGRVETIHLQDANAILPHLDDFFSQHIRRWAETPFPSLFLDASNRDFYTSLVHRLAPEGKILFSMVRLNGEPVACHFGFLEGRTLYYYKPSYDPARAKLSPGSTLLSALFTYCGESGLDTFDFMRGDDAYKSHFANTAGHTRSYVLHRHRGTLYMSHAVRALRRAARRFVRKP